MSDEPVKISSLLQVRRDGRTGNQMRPQEVKKGPSAVTSADGGAWVSQGGSTVFASVTGPAAAKTSQEDYRKAVVVVTVQRSIMSVPNRGGASKGLLEQRRTHQRALDVSLGLLLSKTFATEIVDCQAYPRTCIAIDVLVVSDDGALPAAASNAAMCALLAAGIKCRSTVGAICMTKLRLNWVGIDGVVNPVSEQQIWLDTSKGEELESGPVVFSAPSTLPSVAGDAASALGTNRQMWLQLALQGVLSKVHQGVSGSSKPKKGGLMGAAEGSIYTEGQLAFLAKQKGVLVTAVDSFFVVTNLAYQPRRIVASKVGTSHHLVLPTDNVDVQEGPMPSSTNGNGITIEELSQLQNFAIQATTKGVTEFTRLCVTVDSASTADEVPAPAAASSTAESS